MEVNELVSAAMAAFDEDCPFCTGSDEAEEVTHSYEVHTDEDTDDPDAADDGPYTLINESGILRKNLSPEPRWIIETDDALAGANRPWIRDGYWLSNKDGRTRSRLCANAHHLIPGNASLGRAKQLLKYFAKTVEWIRVRYKPLPTTERLPYGVTRITFTMDGDDAMDKVTTTRSGPDGKKVTSTKNITGKVKGFVDYDVNGSSNGIWLPSNNAVKGWREVHYNWQEAYVKKAMNKPIPKRQFHDSHKAYSQRVMEVLLELAKELDTESKNCMKHDKGKDGPPFPAPTKLEGSLNLLSGELRKLVTGPPSDAEPPYITSDKWLS
jgi:hypothetical protein